MARDEAITLVMEELKYANWAKAVLERSSIVNKPIDNAEESLSLSREREMITASETKVEGLCDEIVAKMRWLQKELDKF